MIAPIQFAQRSEQLATLNPVQGHPEEYILPVDTEKTDHYIQALKIQKQLDREAQMEQCEEVQTIQLGGGREKKITFHEGRTYQIFGKTFIHKQIIPNEKTNNLELVINSLRDILLKEIQDLL